MKLFRYPAAQEALLFCPLFRSSNNSHHVNYNLFYMSFLFSVGQCESHRYRLYVYLWRNVCKNLASVQNLYKQASQTRSMNKLSLLHLFVLLLFYSSYSSITENKWLFLNFLTSEKLNRSNSPRRRNTVRITQDKILLSYIQSCMLPWIHYFKFTHNIAGNTLPTCQT